MSGLSNAPLVGEPDRQYPVTQPQLQQDARHMGLHGRLIDHQTSREPEDPTLQGIQAGSSPSRCAGPGLRASWLIIRKHNRRREQRAALDDCAGSVCQLRRPQRP